MTDDLRRRVRTAYDRCKLFPDSGRNDDGTFTIRGDAWVAMLELRALVPDIDTALHAATGEPMREADEDDVEAALAGSYVEDGLAEVERAALLEFWNRMLDRFVGERDD